MNLLNASLNKTFPSFLNFKVRIRVRFHIMVRVRVKNRVREGIVFRVGVYSTNKRNLLNRQITKIV